MTQTFRSRDEQVADLAKAIGPEKLYSLLSDEYRAGIDARALQHILEAEARGAAEERGEGGIWQPIETAPKDGTCVLVPVKHIGADVVLWSLNGWRETSNMLLMRDQPTHWMPIPSFPSNCHLTNIAALEARIATLEGVLTTAVSALEQVKDGERGGYKARNGRFVSLQMSDGERADIIHSDVTTECEGALETARAALKREGGV